VKVRKAVIPAAGWGTRFLPATKVVPKEVLPLIDRPVIEFAVNEAAEAGLTDVVLVTSVGKEAILNYFDRAFELEHVLEKKGDMRRLRAVRSVADIVNIISVRQPEQLGLGHAVLMARPVVGDEPFAVLLPDDVIEGPRPALRQVLDVHERFNASVIAVQKVSDADVSRYGIIDGAPAGPRTHKLRKVVEKPRLEDAPSRLAIVGRYVLTPQIFDLLEHGRPGAIGEIQLTDGIDGLMTTQSVYAYEFEGTLHDAGTPLGMLKAAVRVALSRPDMAGEFGPWLRDLVAKEHREHTRAAG
jgi:UTP--glucose-1-phosphate uridylyltransferase